MKKLKIVGLGVGLPKRILTNFDLEKMVDTSDEWITERTGIKERRIADSDTATSDLIVIAAKEALKQANLKPTDLDTIIVGTSTPDTIYPSTACWVEKALGLSGPVAFDVNAGCCGFLYALEIAANLINGKRAKKVLVAGAEVMSKVVNWEDRRTCVLFGDGAGVCIVVPTDEERGIVASNWGSDGTLAELLYQPAGGTRMPASKETVEKKLHTVHMVGNEVFKNAVREMENATLQVLADANLSSSEIDLFIPHQANYRIIDATIKRTNIPLEKTYLVIHKYGNMSAATIPVALHDAYYEGKIKDNNYILFAAFGAGFTWAAMILKW
ncbi:MAG: ketoacyl-ACP synthase III [candidate division WOR-3 bacterium]|nr:ketoacyl-ACP synthase III [candidate division WOR-3 bacterium]MCX7757569.1 ketoacyl-ACP synthase III [candidate division WOR-3 bacterium]